MNWLTLAIALTTFDDGVFARVAGQRTRERIEQLSQLVIADPVGRGPSRCGRSRSSSLFLSLDPIVNLLSSRQRMNASFDPFELVNTYGAFGSVGRERFEVDPGGDGRASPSPSAVWKEYEFPCKPGDPRRRPLPDHALSLPIGLAALVRGAR